MVFIPITDAEIDFKSPISETLTFKARDNQNDLDSRLTVQEGQPREPNNTVLTSAVDSSGRPNYITAGGGLSVDVDGSTTPVEMIIDGKLQIVSSVINVSGLTPNQVNFLFATQTAGLAPTLSFIDLASSTVAPLYSHIEPPSPATDDYWFDLNANVMKRFDGASFVVVKRIFFGVVITNGTVPTVVVAFANNITPQERFDLAGDGSDGNKNLTSGTTTEDGVKKFTFFRLAFGATYESSDPQLDTLKIQSQNPIIVEGTVDQRGHGARPTLDGGRGGAGGGGANNGTDGGGTKRDNATFTGGGAKSTGGGDDGDDGADTPYDAWEPLLDFDLNGAGGGEGDGGALEGEGGGGLVLVAPEIVVVTGGIVDCRGQDGTEAAAGGQAGNGAGGGAVVLSKSRVLDVSGTVNVAGGVASGAPRGGFGGAGKHVQVLV